MSSRSGAYSRTPGTPPIMLGRRETAATGAGSRDIAVGVAALLPTTPPLAAGSGVTTPPATGREPAVDRKADGAKSATRGEESMAPYSEPSSKNGRDGGGGGGGQTSDAGVAREDSTGKKRPYTTERDNAKDLAQYLGVPGPDNDNGSSGNRRGGKRGVGGSTLGTMEERHEGDREGGESQVRGSQQEIRRSRASMYIKLDRETIEKTKATLHPTHPH